MEVNADVSKWIQLRQKKIDELQKSYEKQSKLQESINYVVEERVGIKGIYEGIVSGANNSAYKISDIKKALQAHANNQNLDEYDKEIMVKIQKSLEVAGVMRAINGNDFDSSTISNDPNKDSKMIEHYIKKEYDEYGELSKKIDGLVQEINQLDADLSAILPILQARNQSVAVNTGAQKTGKEGGFIQSTAAIEKIAKDPVFKNITSTCPPLDDKFKDKDYLKDSIQKLEVKELGSYNAAVRTKAPDIPYNPSNELKSFMDLPRPELPKSPATALFTSGGVLQASLTPTVPQSRPGPDEFNSRSGTRNRRG